MRYTEYHADKAVIKDKALLPDAMEKLAKVEDLEEKNTDIDQITTEMMEHICDNICMHPIRVGQTQDKLDDICAECKMGKFVCDILNTYNHQSKQLEEFKDGNLDPIEMCKVAIALDKLKEYQRLEERGSLLKLPCEVGDVVQLVGNKYVNDYEIRRFIVDNTGIDAVQVEKTIEGRNYWNSFSICNFGKTVFLTEQEALAALEKMKGE